MHAELIGSKHLHHIRHWGECNCGKLGEFRSVSWDLMIWRDSLQGHLTCNRGPQLASLHD